MGSQCARWESLPCLLDSFSKTPIIFVHGATNTAKTMEPLAAYFREKGYHDEELYATTYGAHGEAVNAYHERMHCAYVQQVGPVGGVIGRRSNAPI